MKRLVIDVMPGEYVVAKPPADATLPDAPDGALFSVTRTARETSVICPAGLLGEDVLSASDVQPGWRLLTVRGPLEFTLTGIMASLAGSLAQAGVPIFALSTYDTDHVLVRADDLDRAVRALREAGHEVP